MKLFFQNVNVIGTELNLVTMKLVNVHANLEWKVRYATGACLTTLILVTPMDVKCVTAGKCDHIRDFFSENNKVDYMELFFAIDK